MNFLRLPSKSAPSISIIRRSAAFLAASRHLPLSNNTTTYTTTAAATTTNNNKVINFVILGNLLARLRPPSRNMSKDRQSGGFVSDMDKQQKGKSKDCKEHQAPTLTNSPENSCSSSPLKHDSASECTPSKKETSISEFKEKFLALSPEDRRKLYSCQGDFVELNEIETWSDLYKKFKTKDKMKASSRTIKYPVDEEMNTKISLWCGDITRLEIDAIVNAANRTLLGGGGVDGAIHRAAGQLLVAECRTLGGCNVGEAKTTLGYKLPAKYVIHTVGPQDRSKIKLTNCYRNCFEEFHKNKLKSIAFCCISTGIYGYPNEGAVHVALDEARKFLIRVKEEGQLSTIDRIIFCLFLDIDIKLYKEQMQNYFPVVVPADEEDPIEVEEKPHQAKKNKNSSNSSEDEKPAPTSCRDCDDVVLVLDDEVDDLVGVKQMSDVEADDVHDHEGEKQMKDVKGDDGTEKSDASAAKILETCVFEDMSQVDDNYVTDAEMISLSQIESQMDVCEEEETREIDAGDAKASVKKTG